MTFQLQSLLPGRSTPEPRALLTPAPLPVFSLSGGMTPLTTQLSEQFGFSRLPTPTHPVFNESPRPFSSSYLIFLESLHLFPSLFQPAVCYMSPFTPALYSFLSCLLLPKTSSGFSPVENPSKAPNASGESLNTVSQGPCLSLQNEPVAPELVVLWVLGRWGRKEQRKITGTGGRDGGRLGVLAPGSRLF